LEAEAGEESNHLTDETFLVGARITTKNANSEKPAKEPDDHSRMKMPLTRRLGLKNRRIHADRVVDLGILFGEERVLGRDEEQRGCGSFLPLRLPLPALCPTVPGVSFLLAFSLAPPFQRTLPTVNFSLADLPLKKIYVYDM
jgi:hypothetical protein